MTFRVNNMMRSPIPRTVVLPFGCLLMVVLGCRMRQAGSALAPAPPPPSALAPASPFLLNANKPLAKLLAASSASHGRIRLLVEKARYRLTAYQGTRPIKSYPVVFGLDPISDKRREGDRCTPEGDFAIVSQMPHRKWSRFLLLNYPTASSWRKFRAAQRVGAVRPQDTIGGAVGIHGVPSGADWVIAARRNWTAGCISLRTADIIELYRFCRPGTPVRILH